MHSNLHLSKKLQDLHEMWTKTSNVHSISLYNLSEKCFIPINIYGVILQMQTQMHVGFHAVSIIVVQF
jgi:hypothetical protein